VRVAVLALQGDFAAHRYALESRGVEAIEARTADQLSGVDGLVLPGGESTTMLRLMNGAGVAERLRGLVAAGTPVLATCAGVILLAREVRNPTQASLGLLDVTVVRNGYGRQVESAVVALTVAAPDELGSNALEGVFIRAPRVSAVGAGVRVLATRGADPVLLRQGALLAATFHPELSPGSPVLDLFVRLLSSVRRSGR
jgi:5'-phosphate synthase pdxT subunit